MDKFIRDRKNIKWVSMMLPEHREMLIRLEESEDDADLEDLENLSEDRLEEINFAIQEAMAEGHDISLTCYRDHRFHKVTGSIRGYDPVLKILTMEHRERRWKIPIASIADAGKA